MIEYYLLDKGQSEHSGEIYSFLENIYKNIKLLYVVFKKYANDTLYKSFDLQINLWLTKVIYPYTIFTWFI